MKVTSFKSFVVGTPPPGHGGRYFIFVKLTTACGIDGYGEIYAGHIAPDIICQIAKIALSVIYITISFRG